MIDGAYGRKSWGKTPLAGCVEDRAAVDWAFGVLRSWEVDKSVLHR